MLYDPVPRPPAKEVLAVRRPTGHRPQAEILRTRVFKKYSHDFDNNDSAMYILLQKFGSLIPQQADDLEESDLITASYVCYDGLKKYARGVTIQWVNSLSLHFEFDNQQKVLKLFRFPSYCLLMIQSTSSSPLSQ
jgi:hypothetical protein